MSLVGIIGGSVCRVRCATVKGVSDDGHVTLQVESENSAEAVTYPGLWLPSFAVVESLAIENRCGRLGGGLINKGAAGHEGSDGALEFDAFVSDFHRPLLHALVVAVGFDLAADAAAVALAYAWEHWDRVSSMENPRGYVYRTARNSTTRSRAAIVVPLPVADRSSGEGVVVDRLVVEPALSEALSVLSEQQRCVVYLIEGYGLGLTETAQLLDVSVSTVRSHLSRGLARLRSILEVTPDD